MQNASIENLPDFAETDADHAAVAMISAIYPVVAIFMLCRRIFCNLTVFG
jgi:hypothetical protein